MKQLLLNSRQIFDFSSMTTTLFISWHIKRFNFYSLSLFHCHIPPSIQGAFWRPMNCFLIFMWIGQMSDVCFAHGSIKIENRRNILFHFLSVIIKWKPRKLFFIYCWIWKLIAKSFHAEQENWQNLIGKWRWKNMNGNWFQTKIYLYY